MGKAEASSSEHPPPRKTLPIGTVDPRVAAPDVSESTKHARALIAELTAALESDGANAAEGGRIERAWAAWNLNGVNDATVQRVAHLVDRAYHALHENPRGRPSKKSSGLAIS